MYYISTRKQTKPSMVSNAITKGLAPDGGLFVPEQLPTIDWQGWSTTLSYPEFSVQLLYPFFEQDTLASQLPRLSTDTFTFPISLQNMDDTTFVLELFHGPTASFKDFGARFLAQCMESYNAPLKSDQKKIFFSYKTIIFIMIFATRNLTNETVCKKI